MAVPPPVGSLLAPSARARLRVGVCLVQRVGEAPACLSPCRWAGTASRQGLGLRALRMPRHLGGGLVEEAAVAARRASQQRENPWEGPAAGGDAALGGMDVKDDDL